MAGASRSLSPPAFFDLGGPVRPAAKRRSGPLNASSVPVTAVRDEHARQPVAAESITLPERRERNEDSVSGALGDAMRSARGATPVCVVRVSTRSGVTNIKVDTRAPVPCDRPKPSVVRSALSADRSCSSSERPVVSADRSVWSAVHRSMSAACPRENSFAPPLRPTTCPRRSLPRRSDCPPGAASGRPGRRPVACPTRLVTRRRCSPARAGGWSPGAVCRSPAHAAARSCVAAGRPRLRPDAPPPRRAPRGKIRGPGRWDARPAAPIVRPSLRPIARRRRSHARRSS
jgi:hypothetical protein